MMVIPPVEITSRQASHCVLISETISGTPSVGEADRPRFSQLASRRASTVQDRWLRPRRGHEVYDHPTSPLPGAHKDRLVEPPVEPFHRGETGTTHQVQQAIRADRIVL